MTFIDELMNGQQLYRGDTEMPEILDAGRMREAGIGAAKVFGDVGIANAEPFYMRLVDHRIGQRCLRSGIVRPVEGIVNYDRLGYAERAVLVVNFEWIAGSHIVGKDRSFPVNLTCDCLGIRIDQRFGWIEQHSLLGIPRPVHAVVVQLSRLDAVDKTVPHESCPFHQLDAVGLVAVCIVEADFHTVSPL